MPRISCSNRDLVIHSKSNIQTLYMTEVKFIILRGSSVFVLLISTLLILEN